MIKVFLLCSGLGHINRGYESFTQECFDALSSVPELEITLFQGDGPADQEQVTLWNLPRGGRLCEWLGRTLGKSGYWVEQVTFAVSLLPYLAQRRPDVIYFSDSNIGNLLWHWRRLSRQKFKLLFSNGGPMQPPYPRWDWVQQLAPTHRAAALATGFPANRQTLLPYGVRMEPELPTVSPEDRAALCRSLGLPVDRPIVLSVGTVNQGHKRMEYVVREVAALPEPRPFLVLLGQQDEETPAVRAQAENLLGADGCLIRTVIHSEVSGYYQAANTFVLASLDEGFGRVFLEAMSWGLPCLAHDYPLTHYVLGDSGLLADLTQPGSLTTLLCDILEQGEDLPGRERRHQSAFKRFSWQQLQPEYVEMIQECAKS